MEDTNLSHRKRHDGAQGGIELGAPRSVCSALRELSLAEAWERGLAGCMGLASSTPCVPHSASAPLEAPVPFLMLPGSRFPPLTAESLSGESRTQSQAVPCRAQPSALPTVAPDGLAEA